MYDMKKPQVPTSKYKLQTRADAEHAYKNKYTRNKIKTNKEMALMSAAAGLGIMYLVEIVLLAGKLAISKITSVGGGIVHNVASKVPGAVNDAATAAEAANRHTVSPIDILKFLVGFSEPWIALFAWVLAIVGGVVMFFYLHSYNSTLIQRKQAENEMLDENDRYASDVPSLIQESGTDIAMDAKAVVLGDVASITGHINISPDGIHGKDGNITIDTNFQKELQAIAQISSGDLTYDGRPANKLFDARKLIYDTKKKDGNGKAQFSRDKSAKAETVADVINKYLYVPEQNIDSPQPIAGFYIVVTKPVNTTLIAATRAGKGQKYIEPMIDIWMRQKNQPNIIATDPKGELLRKNAFALAIQGYEVKSVNTLNPQYSTAYNIYSYALMAADRGNSEMTARILTGIGDVLFAAEGDNAFWYGSASKLVNLCAEAIIDYALEDARRLRLDPTLSYTMKESKVDDVFGEVSAANVVHILNQLYAATITYEKDHELLELAGYKEDTQALWVFLSLIGKLPMTTLRTNISSDFAFLQAQAGSEKMMSSILTIALQNMSFFREEAITKVTSGNPSKTLDFVGLGFPRRFSMWFDDHLIDLNVLSPAKTVMQVYRDKELTQPYFDEGIKDGKPYEDYSNYTHIGEFEKGWIHGAIRGKLDQDTSYIKLSINNTRGRLVDTFSFEFTKGYRKDPTGNTFERDKLSGQLIVQNGTLREYHLDENGDVDYAPRTFESLETSLAKDDSNEVITHNPYVKQAFPTYTEKPTALFLVAPPQEVTYNRLAIMVIDAAFNEQFGYGVSNPTTPKPFIATKYMLDEFGNIASNGKGIPDMGTKLSIGLSMLQQFTIVLQSFTQIDVLYSKEDRDLMMGNTNVTVFLKSTSEDVIKEVSKLGGTHRKIEVDSLNEDLHLGDMKNIDSRQVSGRVSTSKRAKDEPAIPDNVFKSLGEVAELGEAITYSGSTQSLIQGAYFLPMAFRLLNDRPGGVKDEISNSDMPISTPNAEFDISKNVPNYMEKLRELAERVRVATELQDRWKKRNDITLDSQIFTKISPDKYNALIMSEVFRVRGAEKVKENDPGTLTESQIDRLASGKEILDLEANSIAMNDSDLNKVSIKEANKILVTSTEVERSVAKFVTQLSPGTTMTDILGEADEDDLSRPHFDNIQPVVNQNLAAVVEEATTSTVNDRDFANGHLSLATLDDLYNRLVKDGEYETSDVSLAIVTATKRAASELQKFSITVDYDDDESVSSIQAQSTEEGVFIRNGQMTPAFADFLARTSSTIPDKQGNVTPHLERGRTWVQRGLTKFDQFVGEEIDNLKADD